MTPIRLDPNISRTAAGDAI